MMTTAAAANVHALAVDGTFDDCQALVKALFNHHGFRDSVSLSGVNSINWARIVAQAVYYFTSAVALGAPARSVDFTVPTGNFGDIFAGYVAKRMGLPIGRLRVATNVNDILARTLSSGAYEVREVHETTSPSMDIQVSSNFERLVFEATDRDSAAVRGLMASLGQSGRFVLPAAALRNIREQFDAGRADEDEVNAAIRAAWRESGDLIDPHTAVAVAVSEHAQRARPTFRTSCCRPRMRRNSRMRCKPPAARGRRCPPISAGLMTKPEKITPMPNDRVELERFIRSASRAAKETA